MDRQVDDSKGGTFILRKVDSYPFQADLNLFDYGKRDGAWGHAYHEKPRAFYFLSLVRAGRATLFSGTKQFEIEPGTLMVIFANSTDIHYTTARDMPFSMSWVGVFGTLMPYYLSMLNITPEHPFLVLSNPDAVNEAMERIITFKGNGTIAANLAHTSLLYQFFAVLFDELSTYDRKDYVKTALEYMSARYSTGISSSDVAGYLGIGRSYFAMLFKRVMTITPSEHLENLRVKRAMQLLENTDMTIEQIAEAVGIQEVSYFSRLFRRKVGISPSGYRSTTK